MATIGYVEDTAFEAWATARGITLTGTASVLLTKALDYLELQNYKGTRTDDAQTLSWPRTGVYIDGVLIDKDTIPDQVKELQYRVAADADAGTDPLSVRTQGVKSKSVDGISVEYMEGSSVSGVSRQTNLLLSKLVAAGGGYQFVVSRG